ncbi:hypothetical protein J6590_055912 [Homalodisca vitripennis]|nr:hypothetical protein J6590_055912 [Homalodisca vitripennis]
MNSAMVRMQRLGNSLPEEVDFFFMSEATFRRSVKDFHFSVSYVVSGPVMSHCDQRLYCEWWCTRGTTYGILVWL